LTHFDLVGQCLLDLRGAGYLGQCLGNRGFGWTNGIDIRFLI